MNLFLAPVFSSSRRVRWSSKAVATVALLMGVDEGPTLGDRFANTRAVIGNRVGPRRPPGRTYAGFTAACRRCGLGLVKAVRLRLQIVVLELLSPLATKHGFIPIGIDGSKFSAPRTRANEAEIGISGKNKTHPQFLQTMTYVIGLEVPWDWVIDKACGSERDAALQLVNTLPEQALLVMDAGFTGFDFLKELSTKANFLVRVGSNVRLLRELGFEIEGSSNIVYLWPKQRRDQEPLALRLIHIEGKANRDVYLLTNVLDADQLTDEQAGVFYQLRWGIEVCYRSMKQTLDRRKMRSTTPLNALLELHWTLLSFMLLGLLANWHPAGRNRLARRWSAAEALRLFRRTLRRGKTSLAGFLRALGDAETKTRARSSSKAARCWPHKKDSSPPKPPIIQAATSAEIAAAAAFQDQSMPVW